MSAAESQSYAMGQAFAEAQNELDDLDDPYAMIILRAAPHQWGEGKVHIIDGGRTQCGRELIDVPGKLEVGHLDNVDCQVCTKSRAAHVRFQATREQWAQEQRERQQQTEQQNEDWHAWYADYLKTDQWHEIRRRVMERAQGLCEGCRQRPAEQVHHLTYKRVGAEMLFELVAVCGHCHDRIHSDKR